MRTDPFERLLKTLHLLLGILFSAASLSDSTAIAYEVLTHSDLSARAVAVSDLAAPEALKRLGLLGLAVDNPRQAFSSSTGGAPLSIVGLVQFGSRFEDDLGALQSMFQPLRHFYDPVGDRALDVGGSIGSSKSIKSPDWALEDADTYNGFPGPLAFQNFSYRDAREYFYNALTASTQFVRANNFGLTFQALGQVIHHLQDMAQPQHVRNDPHCDRSICALLASTLNINEIYATSMYEKYTDLDDQRVPGLRIRINLPFNGQGSTPVYPSQNAATSPFKTPRHFWRTTAPLSDISPGKGIAEYTNRNFYSAGTIGTYPSPPRLWVTDYFTPAEEIDVGQLLPGTSLTGKVQFWSSQVTDALTGESRPNPRALSEGILDRDLVQFYSTGGSGYLVFALNRFTFDAAHQFLIPRAVGYSAGLINYFFRGRLEISPPDEGVYGIVDHIVENRADVDGFGKIKLKLRNVTPGGTDARGQPLVERIPNDSPGTLVAVAKFRRNTCYQPDLSGEYGAPGVNWRACRSSADEIVVSVPQPVPNGINDEAKPLAFLFPNKIPINATDLKLQVVYRGPLGEEADAVVVETRDISEPTYLYQYSTLDQYLYASFPLIEPGSNTFQQWCAQGYATFDDCRSSEVPQVKFRFGPAPGYTDSPITTAGEWHPLLSEPPIADVGRLVAPVGTFGRIAVLADLDPTTTVMVQDLVRVPPHTSLFQWTQGTLVLSLNQLDEGTDTLVPSTSYVSGRGIFVPAAAGFLLNAGTAPGIPPLTPHLSQINF